MVSDAEFALALQHEKAGRFQDSFELLRKLAAAGHARAQFMLGEKVMVGRNAPRASAEAARLFDAAAQQDYPAAMAMRATLTAAGFGFEQDWREAVAWLERAAALSNEAAKGQLSILGSSANFEPTPWLLPPRARAAFQSPRIGVIEQFLAPNVCDWLVARARPLLEGAFIVDEVTGEHRPDKVRTNTTAYFGWLETDVVLRLVKSRIAAALGAPVENQEDSSVLHYEVGQVFEPHYDFMHPDHAGFARELEQIGQRVATFLIYLNDGFDGGETAFPRLNWSFKGKKGDAIFFWNVSATGVVEPMSLHAGVAPTRGEKWLFSQWVREKPVERM